VPLPQPSESQGNISLSKLEGGANTSSIAPSLNNYSMPLSSSSKPFSINNYISIY
jgi:hypothetical protein